MRRAQRSRSHSAVVAGILLVAAATNLVATRTLTAPLSSRIEIKDLTWVEVKAAIDAGHTSVIVPTGGIEQNGPHMVVGKHDYIVGYAASKIAQSLGRTLVAPVVSYVPQGGYEPPEGHLRFAGTEGIARSLRAGGFKTILFIGDHGGSQGMQQEVAGRLSRAWAGEGVRVANISAYYDDSSQIAKLVAAGETPGRIGTHAGIIDTSELLAIYPAGVDLSRYVRPLLFPVTTGVAGDPSTASADRGRSLIAMRISAAVDQIKGLMAPVAAK
jgi:creatinine amidohydrolase